MISQFVKVMVERVPQLENCEVDNLSKMASFGTTQSVGPINVEYIPIPSVNLSEIEEVGSIIVGVPWMQSIIMYLRNGDLTSSKSETRRLKYKVARYCLIKDILHRRGFTLPYLKCLGDEHVEYVMREIHKEICGNHY